MRTLLNTFILLLFVACGNSVEFKESPIPKISRSAQVNPESFESVSNKILKPHCIQCHAAYGDYETVFDEKEKILSAVLEGRMPKNAPALSDDLKAILNSWVKSGAPFGTNEPAPEPTELVATWDSLSKKVFFPKCVQCHNPNGQASFLDLSTRQSFFNQRDDLLNNFEDVENSYLLEVITDPEEPMPPVWSNIERLNEKEIQTVIEWIKNGLP